MDIAVLSDIHSNDIALRKCIDYALNKGASNFLFLGDYASDCPYPQRAMQMLYELSEKYNCWFIRGNREEYMINYRAKGEAGWIKGSSSGCLLYTYENLTKEDLDFFEGMPNYGKMQLPGLPAFCYCHGSMNSSREQLQKNSPAAKTALELVDTDILLCGHTHVQGTFKYRGKKLINPGSVGIPFSYNAKAQFAILHGTEKGWDEEYFQLDYEKEIVLEEFTTSGFSKIAPMWVVLTKEILKTGYDASSKALLRAMELCSEETGEANWPYIPEKYWEQAVREQGIQF
jgi:putative phosphoesterase